MLDEAETAMSDSQPGPLILVVEDEETIAEFVTMGLSYAGLQVAVARDGNEGLAVFRRRKPDLVILYVMLPSLVGFAVLSQIILHRHVSLLLCITRDVVHT